MASCSQDTDDKCIAIYVCNHCKDNVIDTEVIYYACYFVKQDRGDRPSSMLSVAQLFYDIFSSRNDEVLTDAASRCLVCERCFQRRSPQREFLCLSIPASQYIQERENNLLVPNTSRMRCYTIYAPRVTNNQ